MVLQEVCLDEDMQSLAKREASVVAEENGWQTKRQVKLGEMDFQMSEKEGDWEQLYKRGRADEKELLQP